MAVSISYRDLLKSFLGREAGSRTPSEQEVLSVELHDTIVRNDVTKCKKLLAQGVSVNSFSRLSYKACSVERRLVSRDGRALPLHLACIYRRPQILELLLHHGANPNLADHMGRLPLQLVIMYWPRIPVIPSWKRLPPEERQYQEYLQQQHKKAKDALALLTSWGATVDIILKGYGQNLLHLAAKYNIDASVEVLFKAGADIDGRDTDGRTPLNISAEVQSYETLHQLVSHGADISLCDSNGNAAIHFLAQNDKAHQSQHISYLIQTCGANPNQSGSHGNTPLHVACDAGNESAIHTLLQHGAKADVVNNDGQTPLFLLLDKISNENCDYSMLCLLQNTGQVRVADKTNTVPALLDTPKHYRLRDELLTVSSQPPTLQWVCRLAIRRAIGLSHLTEGSVQGLPCPTSIKYDILFNRPLFTMLS